MAPLFHHSTKTQLILLFLLSSLAFAVVASNRRKFTYPPAISASETKTINRNVAPQGQERRTIEVVVVTLSRAGFFPKQVILPKKRFVLAINNRLGRTGELSFELFRERANKL